jgi:hypothetical protein
MVQSGRKLLIFWRNALPSSSEREAAVSHKKNFLNLKVNTFLGVITKMRTAV